MDKLKDQTKPEGAWSFDADVTAAFDDMLERSIPQYQVMRKACFDIACKYRKKDTDIVDLGCSRGEAIGELIDKYGSTNHFIGIEISQPMLQAARERFKGLIDVHVVDIRELDLRKEYPAVSSSVTLCILTLQFTPIEYRLKILRSIYKSIVPGGALILVEKILGSTAELDDLMVNLYYDLKRQNGYSEDDIQRKRMSLEGVLVPVTAKWNEEMLRMSGFNQVDCFWRWMNFSGWLAVKE